MTKLPQQLIPGCIFEYLDDNQIIEAFALEVQSTRVRLISINQREEKIPISRVLPWVGPVLPIDTAHEDIHAHLQTHRKFRKDIATNVDTLSLWELTVGNIQEATPAWLASVIWTNPNIDQIAGLSAKLLTHKTHFRFNPPLFSIYSEENVAKNCTLLHTKEAQGLLIEVGQKFLKNLLEFQQNPNLQKPEIEDQNIANLLQQILMDKIKDSNENQKDNIWKDLTKNLPNTPNLALILSKIWGIVDEHYNPNISRANIIWGNDWSDKFQPEINKIKNNIATKQKKPINIPFCSVDTENTKDLDDAFYVEKTNDGYLLYIALACPTLDWEIDSELDIAVAKRTSSIYLPEGTSHMLPENLGKDSFSLTANIIRPSLVLTISLDNNANTQDLKLEQTWVKIAENISFAESAKRFAAKDELFLIANELATKLRQNRLDNGAVIFEQPIADIKLHKEQNHLKIELIVEQPGCFGQMLVGEIMILCNNILGAWALDNDVPLIYRVQTAKLPEHIRGIINTPVEIYKAVRYLAPAKISTKPGAHATVALSTYASATSPLRRYIDFVNQCQIIAKLSNEKMPFSKSKLDEQLTSWQHRLSQIANVQRNRTRYWKFVYFEQNKNQLWRASILDINPNFITLSMPDFQILLRAEHILFTKTPIIGNWYLVDLKNIDPISGEIQVNSVQPENEF